MPQKVIKSIRKLKQKGLYLIQIDDNDYKVSDDLIVNMSLIKGKTLNDEEYQAFLNEEKQDNLFLKAVNYISFQMRSEMEIIEFLKKNNASEDEINAIVTKLKNISLIDDYVLTKAILNSTINTLKGPKHYKQKLYERRINTNYNVEYSENDEIEVLKESIEKNKDKYSKYPLLKQKNLLAQKLIRDGFSEGKVFSFLNQISLTDNSSENLKKDLRKIQSKYSDDKYAALSNSEKRNKIISSLLNKGYSYKDIIKLL